jgi:phenylpropionate dioxygenase-like ring-hydroxylating dioxygenase large terminal subunit
VNPDDQWFPIIRSEELIPGHIGRSALFGQELALWRDSDGRANAWTDRCPHRGVRLSIGLNLGDRLKCQYHGWQFNSQSGQCAFIPAHRDQVPDARLKTGIFPNLERFGFLWVTLVPPETGRPDFPSFGLKDGTTIRSMFMNTDISAVKQAVSQIATQVNDWTFHTDPDLTLFLHPVDRGQVILHGLAAQKYEGDDRIAFLRHQNTRFSHLRRAVEAMAV